MTETPVINAIESCADLFAGDAVALRTLLITQTEAAQINCQNWKTEFPPSSPCHECAEVRLSHCTHYLYVYWAMKTKGLRATHVADLSPVAQENCMELFVQLSGERRYWNFEVNALGTLNASHREERPRPTRLTGTELASVLRSGSHVRQQPIVDDSDTEYDWWVALAIPWTLLGVIPGDLPSSINCNAYACAGGIEHPYYLSLFSIDTPRPDFHQPRFFKSVSLL